MVAFFKNICCIIMECLLCQRLKILLWIAENDVANFTVA